MMLKMFRQKQKKIDKQEAKKNEAKSKDKE